MFLKHTFIRVIRKHWLIGLSLFFVLGLPLLWIYPPRGLIGAYFANRDWQGTPIFFQRDRQISLNTVYQKQATFPQTNFSISWSGWLRIDLAGEYTFATQSDDGSSLSINDKVVVENGGFHAFKKQSGTIVLDRGMHAIRINYLQGAGDYELRVTWIAPGKMETEIPALLLYARPFPLRGFGFLTRNLGIVYPCAWLFLLGVLFRQRSLKTGEKPVQILKAYGVNLSVSLITICIFALFAEGALRLTLYLRENRQDTRLLLEESKKADFQNNGGRTFSLKGMVQASSDDKLVYELKPNLTGNFVDVPFAINSRGFRDAEYSYQKQPNTFRIAGLGDSCLFGWGVKLEDTSLKILERRLNQNSADTRYDVLNFGVPGYNTSMEAEVFLQKVLPYSPDVVLLNVYANDFDAPFFRKLPQSYSTLRKSYLFDLIYSRYQMLSGGQNQETVAYVSFKENPDLLDEYKAMSGHAGFIGAIETLVNETKSRGLPLIVYALLPYPDLHSSYTPHPLETDQLKLLTRLSAEKGFFFLNTYPAYIAYTQQYPETKFPDDFWVSGQDIHPNALAHSIDANALYEFLSKHKITDCNDCADSAD